MSTTISYAAEIYESYNGIRQMGMGGASVAVVNDETALFLNPAALGKLRDPILTLVDPEAGGNSAMQTFLGGSAVPDLLDPQSQLNWLNQNKGTHFHTHLQVFPSIVTTNFGFGIIDRYSYDGEVDSTGTNYTLNYTNDIGPVLGTSLRFFDGKIKIGGSARIINRIQAKKTIPANSQNLTWSSIADEGVGIAGEVGMIVTGPWVFLPSIAAVIHDVGTTSYNVTQGQFLKTQTRPENVDSTVDVGFSISPIISNHTRMQITGEYQDVRTASQETSQIRRLHAGLEYNIYDVMFFRGGLNQGYWTAGFELNVNYFQIQAATYGEEIGTALVPKEDRRYSVKFTIRF